MFFEGFTVILSYFFRTSTQATASTDICDVKLLLSPMELLLSPMVQYKHVVATLLFEEIIS
jgi:hypothetical protein